MIKDKSGLFLHYWNLLAVFPLPVPEYRFDAKRLWRFDWAWVEHHVAVEVEGNAWGVRGGGRHMQDKDLEKYNMATLAGWRVFRFSPNMLLANPTGCIEMITKALEVQA
jgi:very-short-patch-repair endonuclease